jgi:hypothetical protein
MAELFSGGGGYRWLDSWVMGNIIQLGTHRFCDPLGQAQLWNRCPL